MERLTEFLRWFDDFLGMRPVWLCPLRLREPGGPGTARTWPAYPLRPGRVYVNVGFWGTVPIESRRADGDVNRRLEEALTGFQGHKSLYSDAYYEEQAFWARYGGGTYAGLKHRYDPQGRLLDLYAKAVRRR